MASERRPEPKPSPRETLKSRVIRNGSVLAAGSPVPSDLTEAERTRLKRLGVL